MPQYKAEKLLLLLVLITLAALLFREPLLQSRYVIDASSTDLDFILDDDNQDGGNSVSEWLSREDLRWRCELKAQYLHPFCGMQIRFSDSVLDGVDLSKYSSLDLDLEYEGEANSFRVFFRNAHPTYTKADDIRSAKFNTAELGKTSDSIYRNVQLAHFRVVDWWLQLYDVPLEHTQIDFRNISIIEIQTGTAAPVGEHVFQLNKLEIAGDRVSNEQLYFAIIVCWIAAIVLYLGSRIRLLNRALHAGKKRQQELTQINTLLDQRHKTLEEKIKHDPLTGAYNREGIEESLTEAIQKWNVEGKPLALVIFDVDHFKNINDTRGHAIGDNVLREISGLVSDSIRGSDRFARWGGEEFIIVCANTDIDQAYELAEKLRKRIDGAQFVDNLRVSVSFGVAAIRRGESLESLFNRTDLALYVAKNQGRNRVSRAE
jgi:diguanylate cyclase (GGDEF)-like protein